MKDYTGSVSWRDAIVGALVGLLITSMFQPFVVSAMTDFYVETSIYKKPTIDTEFTKVDIQYPEGTEVQDFGGMQWKKEYELYRLKISNSGSKVVQDLAVYTALPGCTKFVNTEGPSVDGNYKIDNLITTRFSNGTLNQTGIRTFQCSKKISKDFLDPHESIVVEFIVKDEFEKCDLLMGIPNNPKIVTTYRWEVSGQLYSESEMTIDKKVWNWFTRFTQKNPGKGAFMRKVEGVRYGVFIRTNAKSLDAGLRNCGANWK